MQEKVIPYSLITQWVNEALPGLEVSVFKDEFQRPGLIKIVVNDLDQFASVVTTDHDEDEIRYGIRTLREYFQRKQVAIDKTYKYGFGWPAKVFGLAEGESITNSPNGKSITLQDFEEAYRKVEALKPEPSKNCVMIRFPLMDWRERFPKFKALFTSQYDYIYGEVSILGIPVQITPAVPYMEAHFIIEDGSIKIVSLKGVC